MAMRVALVTMLVGVGCCATAARAQVANPVVTSSQEVVQRQAKYIIAAAAEMPAEKYGYHPTPDQRPFGWIVNHLVGGNTKVCAMLTDAPAPVLPKLSESSPKDELTAALKTSFDYCATAMNGLQDARLGDTITFFGGAKKPRARALVELTGDLEDHYSQMAAYLRGVGLTPPSAMKH